MYHNPNSYKNLTNHYTHHPPKTATTATQKEKEKNGQLAPHNSSLKYLPGGTFCTRALRAPKRWHSCALTTNTTKRTKLDGPNNSTSYVRFFLSIKKQDGDVVIAALTSPPAACGQAPPTCVEPTKYKRRAREVSVSVARRARERRRRSRQTKGAFRQVSYNVTVGRPRGGRSRDANNSHGSRSRQQTLHTRGARIPGALILPRNRHPSRPNLPRVPPHRTNGERQTSANAPSNTPPPYMPPSPPKQKPSPVASPLTLAARGAPTAFAARRSRRRCCARSAAAGLVQAKVRRRLRYRRRRQPPPQGRKTRTRRPRRRGARVRRRRRARCQTLCGEKVHEGTGGVG